MNMESDSINDLLPGKFFNTDDVREKPVTLTIAGFEVGTLKGQDGAETKAGFVCFEGTDRRLVVKPAIVENLRELFGASRSAMIGKRVEAYFEKNVSFGGKKVGGLRLRAASGAAAGSNKDSF
jgi:hypothetical protein